MKYLSRLGRFLKRNWSILFGIVGMIPILFLILIQLVFLFAPANWNEMCVPLAPLL